MAAGQRMSLLNNSLTGSGLFQPLQLPQQPAGFQYGLPVGQSPITNATVQSNLAIANGQGQPGGFFDWWGNNGESVTQGIGALSGLASLYAGFKALGMQEDQFKLNKEVTMRNFNASATDYNNRQKDTYIARSTHAARAGKEFAPMETWLQGRTIEKMS